MPVDKHLLNRQLISALTKPPTPPQRIFKVVSVDRSVRTADLNAGGARITLRIVSQELTDALHAEVAAGRQPSVVVVDREIVRRTSGTTALAASGRSPVLGPPRGPEALPAPLVTAVDGGVLAVAVAWEPIVGASVIGYRIRVVGADGVTQLVSVDADSYRAVIADVAAGRAQVAVQAIGAGGVAGTWSGTQQVEVTADTIAPDPPTLTSHSWSLPEPGLDLTIVWEHPPTIPGDFAGFEIEVRNLDGTARLTTFLDGLQRSFTYPFASNRTQGLTPILEIAVRSVDRYGNASAWESLRASYPALTKPVAVPVLTTSLKQVRVSLPFAPPRAVATLLTISPGPQNVWLAPAQTSATFSAATGAAYTVTYQWQDAFGRFTAASPPSTITVTGGEIGFSDLNVLEQARLSSTDPARTQTQLRALIDANQTTTAFTTTTIEQVTFQYPLGRHIAGVTIYTATGAGVAFSITYVASDGTVRRQGSNAPGQRTLAGTLNDMILREYSADQSDVYLSMAPQLVGGRYQIDLRFGDATADPATRKYQPITSAQVMLEVSAGTGLCEVEWRTYEAAFALVGKVAYLSDGLVIENDAGTGGFRITTDSISGYNPAGVEQVRIDSADGKLKAGGGAVVLDAKNYVSVFNGSGGLAGTLGIGTDRNSIGLPASALKMQSSDADASAGVFTSAVASIGEAAMLSEYRPAGRAIAARVRDGSSFMVTNGTDPNDFLFIVSAGGTSIEKPLTVRDTAAIEPYAATIDSSNAALSIAGSEETARLWMGYNDSGGGNGYGMIGAVKDGVANTPLVLSPQGGAVVGVGRVPSAAGARLDVESGIGVNGLKVLGPRMPAITAPSASVADCQRAINDILNVLRIHGLIS